MHNDVLLIGDEVMCGFGRVGEWFAFQHFGFQPDNSTRCSSELPARLVGEHVHVVEDDRNRLGGSACIPFRSSSTTVSGDTPGDRNRASAPRPSPGPDAVDGLATYVQRRAGSLSAASSDTHATAPPACARARTRRAESCRSRRGRRQASATAVANRSIESRRRGRTTRPTSGSWRTELGLDQRADCPRGSGRCCLSTHGAVLNTCGAGIAGSPG